ncbi:MAG: hypothetical protein B7O98_00340 [Zestosphaera tikiterensis]|uniref:Uncharacterized protein n=1 Tax=Zestosphaera tikiterensis TaxID=1973259 RepID=A0A2R7Y8Q4_9CREN|nr:MAG: hypothetical protein B7O98_00340 [Zestosphaera tikiterensis]
MYNYHRVAIMSGVRVLKISIPEHIGIDEYEARLLLAVELYREGRLTLKQSAELAGLCVEDFMRELSRRKVSIINLDEEELKEELRVAEDLARETRN